MKIGLNPQVLHARIPGPNDITLMPSVMAKFKKKTEPGKCNKKRDTYVHILELVDNFSNS